MDDHERLRQSSLSVVTSEERSDLHGRSATRGQAWRRGGYARRANEGRRSNAAQSARRQPLEFRGVGNLVNDASQLARRAEKFSSPIARDGHGGTEWSALVWQEGRDVGGSLQNPPVASARIGLGRATGLSRVPDESLAKSADLMGIKLKELLGTSKQLEAEGLAVVLLDGADAELKGVLAKAITCWDSLLADFRQLTMAVTASSVVEVQSMARNVYEGAADACLLSGNLSFYLACQTRLLSGLYHDNPVGVKVTARGTEFISYSLLYFGVFCEDNREVARIMRSMDSETVSSEYVKFALQAVVALKSKDTLRFIELFGRASVRQKTLLNPSLQGIRKDALSRMTRAYLSLNKEFALTLTGLQSESAFLKLLASERPDLETENTQNSVEYTFRAARNK